jgi:hypothetical protein
MITEQEFEKALLIVDEYNQQVKKHAKDVAEKSQKALQKSAIYKTPKEIRSEFSVYFPTMSVRLRNIIMWGFDDVKICDITKSDFLKQRNSGIKTWKELCDITGNNY